MAHCIVKEAEEILDKEFKVLDKGFLRLVDYMGSDERIVQAARVSYGSGTKSYREDAALIDYLLRNEHTSPFEQVVLTFHARMPIFVARQWVRHRTARLNEISGRYSVMEEAFYIPQASAVAPQSKDNKQGRASEGFSEDTAEDIIKRLEQGQKRAYAEYMELVDMGLARELARINLPLSLYTEWYWQIDLHNLFRFLRLRLDEHAQYEIREYARVMLDITKKVCPRAVASFEQHMLGAVKFSKKEFELIKKQGLSFSDEDKPEDFSDREWKRFIAKLKDGRQR